MRSARGAPPMTPCRPPTAEDLERLATAAYMLGRDDDHVAALERAHHAHRTGPLAAARARSGSAINLTLRGESRAAGWFERARRLVEREGRECVEQGYLTLARMFEHEAAGDREAAIAAAAEAAAIGERFGDADLFALAAQDQGHHADRARAGSRRAWRCSTRRWWRSPPASCRRSSTASSTAA